MSKTLSDYAVFTQKTRNGIIGRKNREEAIGMSLFEYDEEKHMKFVREEGWEDGYAKGCETGLQQGREEGREQGQKEGQKQGQLQVLTSLIKQGILTVEEAAGIAGLPAEELKAASSK